MDFSATGDAPLQNLLQPLEDAIRNRLIPALFGHQENTAISDLDRALYALPSRLGGLNLDNPMEQAKHKFRDSVELSKCLKDLIENKGAEDDPLSNPAFCSQTDDEDQGDSEETEAKESKTVWEKQREARKAIKSRRRLLEKAEAERVLQQLPQQEQRAVELAQRKGASAIFTTLPLEKYGFTFASKRDFRDILCMRYRKHIPGLPARCTCLQPYSLDHSQICPKGGFIALRHDEPKNLFGRLARRVFRDVEVEPELEQLSGEVLDKKSANRQDEARSDVRVRNFWGNRKDAFFEFRVFYPFASSHASKKTAEAMFLSVEKARKREYEERINVVDNGSFSPMILASTGGIGDQMSMALKVLAERLAGLDDEEYSEVMGMLRSRFAFAIARSALVCLRGSRSLWNHTDKVREHDYCSSRLLMAETRRF